MISEDHAAAQKRTREETAARKKADDETVVRRRAELKAVSEAREAENAKAAREAEAAAKEANLATVKAEQKARAAAEAEKAARIEEQLLLQAKEQNAVRELLEQTKTPTKAWNEDALRLRKALATIEEHDAVELKRDVLKRVHQLETHGLKKALDRASHVSSIVDPAAKVKAADMEASRLEQELENLKGDTMIAEAGIVNTARSLIAGLRLEKLWQVYRFAEEAKTAESATLLRKQLDLVDSKYLSGTTDVEKMVNAQIARIQAHIAEEEKRQEEEDRRREMERLAEEKQQQEEDVAEEKRRLEEEAAAEQLRRKREEETQRLARMAAQLAAQQEALKKIKEAAEQKRLEMERQQQQNAGKEETKVVGSTDEEPVPVLTQSQLVDRFNAMKQLKSKMYDQQDEKSLARVIKKLKQEVRVISAQKFHDQRNESLRQTGVKNTQSAIVGKEAFAIYFYRLFPLYKELEGYFVANANAGGERLPHEEQLSAASGLRAAINRLQAAQEDMKVNESPIPEARRESERMQKVYDDFISDAYVMLMMHKATTTFVPGQKEAYFEELGSLIKQVKGKPSTHPFFQKLLVVAEEDYLYYLMNLVASATGEQRQKLQTKILQQAGEAGEAELRRAERVIQAKLDYERVMARTGDDRYELTLETLYARSLLFGTRSARSVGSFPVSNTFMLNVYPNFMIDKYFRIDNAFVCAPHVQISTGSTLKAHRGGEGQAAVTLRSQKDMHPDIKFINILKEKFVSHKRKEELKAIVKRGKMRSAEKVQAQSLCAFTLLYTVFRCLEYSYVLVPFSVKVRVATTDGRGTVQETDGGHSNFLIIDLRDTNAGNVSEPGRKIKVIHVEPNGSSFGNDNGLNTAVQQILTIANEYNFGIQFDTNPVYGAVSKTNFHTLMGKDIGGGVCTAVNYFMLSGWIDRNVHSSGGNVSFNEYRENLIDQMLVQKAADPRANGHMMRQFLIGAEIYEDKKIASYVKSEVERKMKESNLTVNSDSDAYVRRDGTEKRYVIHVHTSKSDGSVSVVKMPAEAYFAFEAKQKELEANTRRYLASS